MAGRAPSKKPSLRVERQLQRAGHRLLAGMDEVGRGALAGPVSVGVVVIDETVRSAPTGVKDSKLLTERARKGLVPRIRRWCVAHSVGHASPDEIDELGIMAALRLAGLRALSAVDVVPDLVILDGNHDWLTAPSEVGLLAYADPAGPTTPPVTTMIKADLKCSSVAAASVLAKVERDDLMVQLGADHPAYGWGLNKGYSAPEHLDALARLGPCELHRRSWRLPGVYEEPDIVVPDGMVPGRVLNEGAEPHVSALVATEQTGTAVR
ncbi:ribonuclease HII [Intrasporangium sp.]|uniref:ribonuclease HII n=1 Tax=Intrasporangium sp. TaxID=1925024 RepID=UPI002939895B|nr:ribonuclease HII [Intrasporangium sp.]MDV3221635.1 ribonuclease HII [Intrasporangium sp.]